MPRTSATSRRTTHGWFASAARACFTAARSRLSATGNPAGAKAERRARLYYRLRGYRILAANAWAGGAELDLVVRRGNRLVFSEVKSKRQGRFGDPLEAVGPEKQQRLRRAAETWLARRPELGALEVSFEVVAERAGKLERLRNAF